MTVLTCYSALTGQKCGDQWSGTFLFARVGGEVFLKMGAMRRELEHMRTDVYPRGSLLNVPFDPSGIYSKKSLRTAKKKGVCVNHGKKEYGGMVNTNL